MKDRLLKDKKTNCFYETLVTLEIILLIKARAQKPRNSLQSDLGYPAKCVLTWRSPEKNAARCPSFGIASLQVYGVTT